MLQTQPLAPPVGVELLGFELSRGIEESDARVLRQLLLDHQLLVFRGLRLTASDQVEILRAFGPICVEAADGSLHTWVSNERADGRLAERNLPFHSDFFFTAHPHPVLSLYAEHLEGRDVPTDFANAVHACATLPDDLRRRIEGRAQRALTIAVTSFFSHFARSNTRKTGWSESRATARACSPHRPFRLSPVPPGCVAILAGRLRTSVEIGPDPGLHRKCSPLPTRCA